MERSLSIVLPVQNAETTLRADLERLLAAASELTHRFELLVIDNGSQDHTIEVARELATRYPQVRAMRSVCRLPLAELVHCGLESSRGDVVCIHEENGAASASELHRLWRIGGGEQDGKRATRGAGYRMFCRSERLDVENDSRPLAATSSRRMASEPAGPLFPQRPNFLNKLRRFACEE